MFVVLKPFEERRDPETYDAAIAKTLQAKIAEEVEGAVVGVFRSPPIRGVGNAGGFQFQVEQHGYVDLVKLEEMTDELVKKANGPRPTLPSSQLARPKFGSKTHRKMMTVAIVETTTGTNTAVR